MIKLNKTPLNIANKLYYKCDKCGKEGSYLLNSVINTDDNGSPINKEDIQGFECISCNHPL
jgi:hypothetical protein